MSGRGAIKIVGMHSGRTEYLVTETDGQPDGPNGLGTFLKEKVYDICEMYLNEERYFNASDFANDLMDMYRTDKRRLRLFDPGKDEDWMKHNDYNYLITVDEEYDNQTYVYLLGETEDDKDCELLEWMI